MVYEPSYTGLYMPEAADKLYANMLLTFKGLSVQSSILSNLLIQKETVCVYRFLQNCIFTDGADATRVTNGEAKLPLFSSLLAPRYVSPVPFSCFDR